MNLAKSITLTLLVGLSSCVCTTAQFSVKPIPAQYLSAINTQIVIPEVAKGQKIFKLESALPANYDKTGGKDYTTIIQRALNQNDVVELPPHALLVNDAGLKLKSNQVLLFQKGSKLVLKPSAKERYYILHILDANNVQILNAVIEGDRKSHAGRKGEWGMGIHINGGKNITIKNATISECWGDGICIGPSKIRTSENIVLQNIIVNNNRRNGLSLTSGKNITVSNMIAANANGTSPEMGIDLEPDQGGQLHQLQNVRFNNVITYNNKRIGLGLVLQPLLVYTSANIVKNVTIDIDNFTDDGSERPFVVSTIPSSSKRFNKYWNNKIGGAINVRNLTFKNNQYTQVVDNTQTQYASFLPRIDMQNVSIHQRGQIKKASGVELLKTTEKSSLKPNQKIDFQIK